MIGAWNKARVQVGQELVVPFDVDKPDATWALHTANGVPWMSFADEDDGTCRGVAVAGEGGLLVVTATSGGEVDTAAVLVEVVPAGFRFAYDMVRAPEGAGFLAVPETWGVVEPVRFAGTSLPQGVSVDPQTGAVRGSMPAGGGMVGVGAVNGRGDAAAASLRLVATEASVFEAFLAEARVREGGESEIAFVAGQLVDKVVETPGAVPPLSASLVSAPGWASVEDGDEVRLGGTAQAGAGGWIRLDVVDSLGARGRLRAWAVVTDALPFGLEVPDRVVGEAGDLLPGELYARLIGGTPPFVLAVEQPATGFNVSSVTRQITGMFPANAGVVPVRLSATDANNLKVFATMDVESLNPVFRIMQPNISVVAGGRVNEQPTVTGGTAARWWAKQGGPPWLNIDENTGRITGNAPLGSEASEITLFSISTLGVRATLDVRVEVTQGAVSCSIPAISAVRGTSGSRQMSVRNAPGGWTATKESGPAWASVSASGVISWGSLGATDTDVSPIVVRVTRTADSATQTCRVVPTIRDPTPVSTVTCSISGPSTLAPGTSATYTVSAPGASAWTLDATVGVFTVTALGGGRFRVTAATGQTLGASYSFSGGVTVGSLSGSCSHSVDYEYPLTCSVPSLSITHGENLPSPGPFTSESGRPGSTFTLSSSDLPGNLTLTSNGIFGGGSTLSVGSHSFTVTVTESGTGRTSTCSGSITVTAVAATPSCSTPAISFQEGSPGSYSMSGSGGTSPYTYAASGLPSGVSLSSGGSFSGLSGLAIGSYNYSVTITDANNQTGTCSGTITVTEVPVVISCGATPNLSGVVGRTFRVQLPNPSGITGTLTYSKNSGPAWISVSASGVATGTYPSSPTTGSWSYSVSGTGGSCTGGDGTITVSNPPLTCSAGSATGFRGEAISTSVSASGGSGGYSYALDSSSASGITLSGTTITLSAQSADGSFAYRINVTDSDDNTTHCSGTITVSGARLSLAVAGDTGGEPGDTLTGTLTGSGGSGGYGYGSSTTGVTVDASTGAWSYTIPSGSTRGTTETLTFFVTDSSGARVNRSRTINVEYAPLTLSITGASGGEPGDTVEGTGTFAGGSGGWTVTTSTSGLTLGEVSSGGVFAWSYEISSSAALGSSINLAFNGRDSAGNTRNASRTITVQYATLTLTGPSTLYPVTGGVTRTSYHFTFGGGDGSYTISARNVPTGTRIDRSPRGTYVVIFPRIAPEVTSGSWSFTIRSGDGQTATASGTFQYVDLLTVSNPPRFSIRPNESDAVRINLTGGLPGFSLASGSAQFRCTTLQDSFASTINWNATSSRSRSFNLTLTRDNADWSGASACDGVVRRFNITISDDSGQTASMRIECFFLDS